MLLLLGDRSSLRVSEVSRELGVSCSTAHRLLAMLHAYGFVEQDGPTRAYQVGPALADLALSAAHRTDRLVEALHPSLLELSRLVNETAHIIVLEGSSCLFVDSVESTQGLRTTGRVGTRYPAYVVSGGKALLAELDGAQLLELFPERDLPALNERSITDRDQLLEELEAIHRQGYATNYRESEMGIAAVAVVQHTASGATPAALAVSAPETRMSEERVADFVSVLKSVTERARQRLP